MENLRLNNIVFVNSTQSTLPGQRLNQTEAFQHNDWQSVKIERKKGGGMVACYFLIKHTIVPGNEETHGGNKNVALNSKLRHTSLLVLNNSRP